ncbi:MAG: YhfT family protein [Chloroflexota bacterium]|nr:MAG: hypothetical protein DLM70_05665 [Chloroflexota bacterium]
MPLDRAAVEFPISLLVMASLFAAIGSLSCVLANRGISIFHDGLRPLIPDMMAGRIPRSRVARTSFDLGLGFVWSFSVPFSIGLNVPIVHIIFMATDWFGVSMPADYQQPWYATGISRRGTISSALIGAVWGVVIALALRGIYEVFRRFPVPLLTMTAEITAPALATFFLFPVLTIAYHYGLRAGFVSLGVAALAWYVSMTLSSHRPATWAFLAAAAVLTGYFTVELATRGETAESPFGDAESDLNWVNEQTETDEASFFAANVERLKRAILPNGVLYGLMGAAFNYPVFANEPIQGVLYAHGLVIPAVLVALSWGFAYMPMKFTTAAATGCMATGSFLDAAVAMLMPNPVVAFVALFLLRIVETYSLLPSERLLERYPVIREVADFMRTAQGHVMEIAFLVGGALAANSIAGGFGVAAIIALWWLNNRAHFPVMPVSVGALGAILVGLLINLFRLIGLTVH